MQNYKLRLQDVMELQQKDCIEVHNLKGREEKEGLSLVVTFESLVLRRRKSGINLS